MIGAGIEGAVHALQPCGMFECSGLDVQRSFLTHKEYAWAYWAAMVVRVL